MKHKRKLENPESVLQKRKPKNPESVNFKSLIKFINKEMKYIEKMKYINRKKLKIPFKMPI
jgi:hypothetical protein